MSVKLPLEIRPVQIEELEALRQLAEVTFVAAFATQNTAQDMEEYVRKSFSQHNFYLGKDLQIDLLMKRKL
ncbi:MAG: hypothetical protein AAFZ63_05600 [Bacteroidota bacterium]